MQLVLRRSQKTAGMLSKSVLFCLDARVDLSPEEAASVKKYGLGAQVLYNSTAAKGHLEKVNETAGGSRGFLSGAVNLALAKMALNITVSSLTSGHHIECKDLDELLGAEGAIKSACETVRTYLDIAATFDGREIIVDLQHMAAA
jgi:hypothetical protein